MSNISLCKRITFAACLVAVVSLPSVASAELNKLAPKMPSRAEMLKKKPKPYEMRFNRAVGISNLAMSLLRTPEMQDGQFLLRLSTHEKAISGCIHFNDFTYETKYDGRYLDLTLTGISVDPESIKTKAPQYECAGAMQNPKADIVLSRDEIKTHDAKILRIHSGFFTDYYNIQLTDNKVELLHADSMSPAQYFKPFKSQQIVDPMTLWFYPKGTLILSVPDANPKDASIKEKLDNFATARGMQPLDMIVTGFKSPLVNMTDYYYVDTRGLAKLSDPVIGSLPMQATRYGLQGDETVDVGLPIYARTPGMYE